MRLLIVVNDAAFFLSHRLPIALGAQAAGYDVHVATPRSSAAPKIEAAGLSWHAIPLSRRGLSPLGEAQTTLALIRLYRTLLPDVVHHVTAKPILYGGLAARVARVPAVVHAVSGLGFTFISKQKRARLIQRGIRLGYRVATGHQNCAVIFQNQDDRDSFHGAIKTPHIVFIGGSGVDLGRFKRQPLPHDETPLIVVPSRMLWDKGIREVVGAARRLRDRGVRARVVLAGGVDDGNPASVSQGQLEAWANEGLVDWWGHREDMPDVLAKATIVCLPSYREGMPKSLLEACVIGRPIVTTDVPGCRDAVGHGAHGVLVPARDEIALADALTSLLRDRPRVETLAAMAAEAGANFGVESVVARTLDVYASLSPVA